MSARTPDPAAERSRYSARDRVHLIPGRPRQTASSTGFDEAVGAFVADCRARALSERTVEFYLEALTSFRASAEPGETVTLRSLDLTAARRWIGELAAGQRRPSTVAARVRGLKVFSAWLAAEGYVRADPLARLRGPRIPRTLIATFSEPEVAELIDAAPPALAIVLRVLFDTGLRLGEASYDGYGAFTAASSRSITFRAIATN